MAIRSDSLLEPDPIRDFDPFGMAFRNDPLAFHGPLIAASPGRITMEGVPSAFVASHAHCSAVLRDFKNWSSIRPADLPGIERIDFVNSAPVMNYADPPEHNRLRGVVNGAFAPKRVEHLGARTQILIDQFLDDIDGRQTFDAATDIFRDLAVELLLGDFLGLDKADYHYVLDYVATLPLLDTLRPGEAKPQLFLEMWEKGTGYCRQAVERARREPSDSVLSLIVNGGVSGRLSDEEMMAMLSILFTGGISTLGAAATATLYSLVVTPGLIARLNADAELAPAILEESLRLFPPVSLVLRFARNEVQLGDEIFAPATPMYVMLASANRDPTVFPDPARFDLGRANHKTHLSFGYGVHTCIGNAITRHIIPTVIRTIARRLPMLRHADPDAPVPFSTTPRTRHIEHLALAV